MQRLKALDEVTPVDLWREVPLAEDEFWADARERQRRLLKVLLEGALEHPEGEREAFLSSACAGDASLRREVESLIASPGDREPCSLRARGRPETRASRGRRCPLQQSTGRVGIRNNPSPIAVQSLQLVDLKRSTPFERFAIKWHRKAPGVRVQRLEASSAQTRTGQLSGLLRRSEAHSFKHPSGGHP